MTVQSNIHDNLPSLVAVEEVMSRVTALGGENAATSAPLVVKRHDPAGDDEKAIRVPPNLVIKQRYCLAELLAGEDQFFLQHAYLCLLGRCCDEQGQKHYEKALQTGSLDKLEILGRLRYGAEGRRSGVRVNGLLAAFIWKTLGRAASRIGFKLARLSARMYSR